MESAAFLSLILDMPRDLSFLGTRC